MKPDADELRALADRVEAATGADREIDCHIFAWIEGRGVKPEAWVRTIRVHPHFVPRFTASLDAVASLVPPDWHVTVRGLNDSWHVEMNTTWAPTAERPARTVTAFCGNEPRARTAAALRARAEELTDE